MVLSTKLWTSDLFIQTEANISKDGLNFLVKCIASDLEYYSKFHNSPICNAPKTDIPYKDIATRLHIHEYNLGIFEEFVNYSDSPDFTGLLKGAFIDDLVDHIFVKFGEVPLLVNFGGDIYSIGYNLTVDRDFDDCPKMSFQILGNMHHETLIFTSGNGGKRGDHIKTFNGNYIKNATVVINQNPSPRVHANDTVTCAEADMISTLAVSDLSKSKEVQTWWNADIYVVDSSNKVYSPSGYIYIASPFFVEKEIQLRDKMISHLQDYFRPDQTDDNKKYDAKGGESHTKEIAVSIMENNVKHVKECFALVFPEGTDDVGTLFEIGLAISRMKPIIRYNEKSDSYLVIYPGPKFVEFDNDDLISAYANDASKDDLIIDCRSASGAVLMGELYECKKPMYYLGNVKDNLMLCSTFDRIVDREGDLGVPFKIVEPDFVGAR